MRNSQRRSRSARTRRSASRLLPPATAAARSVPRSRTSARMPSPIRAASTPNTTDTPRQPSAASIGVPTTAMTTVPRFPPAIWALIANPRRAGGNCSARRPFPTGCCGEPPIRGEDVGIAKVREVVGQGRGREPATEHEAAQAQQPAAGDAPGQLRVAELDHPRREGAHRGEDRHGRDRDAELVDDREEDRRQQHGIGVVDRVRHREQAERAHRMDRRQGMHRAILPGQRRSSASTAPLTDRPGRGPPSNA